MSDPLCLQQHRERDAVEWTQREPEETTCRRQRSERTRGRTGTPKRREEHQTPHALRSRGGNHSMRVDTTRPQRSRRFGCRIHIAHPGRLGPLWALTPSASQSSTCHPSCRRSLLCIRLKPSTGTLNQRGVRTTPRLQGASSGIPTRPFTSRADSRRLTSRPRTERLRESHRLHDARMPLLATCHNFLANVAPATPFSALSGLDTATRAARVSTPRSEATGAEQRRTIARSSRSHSAKRGHVSPLCPPRPPPLHYLIWPARAPPRPGTHPRVPCPARPVAMAALANTRIAAS